VALSALDDHRRQRHVHQPDQHHHETGHGAFLAADLVRPRGARAMRADTVRRSPRDA
jgi:hypothetical protein